MCLLLLDTCLLGDHSQLMSERTFFRVCGEILRFQKTVGHFHFGSVFERTFSLRGGALQTPEAR